MMLEAIGRGHQGSTERPGLALSLWFFGVSPRTDIFRHMAAAPRHVNEACHGCGTPQNPGGETGTFNFASKGYLYGLFIKGRVPIVSKTKSFLLRRFFSRAVSLVALLLPLGAQDAGAQEATIKILAFGDSLVRGYGLPAGVTFPEQLEVALKADGFDVRVINGGNSGDTTAEACQ